ncbi:aminodeoxychorismate synthase component I [Streptomyces hiroshimensis]|uniref:aminodeoxychorismate synthase n=1 Tax=Streptomyces hiroshimensis TaxID=66424 RepID=A0ABQ2YRV8_9ACTN|nr:aminodeoxychorismate synthase component I [Streptomyces hiroshimensis]GGX93307.1 aminodeoxychorismate synthase, component I [Streptomyces hiroshimensis]
MRTLLVDNYDSFTYNLFHYLARVNGQPPEVVRNDDPDWHPGRLAEFDNVVLSPGPGTPLRDADFGICRAIAERTDLPLLGVCLGHQGIGMLHGATVGRAPRPHHGRTSPVLHDGTGLFAGLPSPFEVVRYHSLAVTDLPGVLKATAWTPDGVLMGLEHRERPQWGVQFHPESAGSHYGIELLANFRRLTEERRPANRTANRPTVELTQAPPAPAAHPRRTLRVLAEQLPTRWDDETVHARLFGGDGDGNDGDGRHGSNPHTFWLDSSRRDGELGRFSFMGDASGPLARVAKADVWTSTVTVHSAGGARTDIVSGAFLEWLDRDLAATRASVPELPFDFALGWVGYLGYELKAECGSRAVHRSEEPDAYMVFADRAVVLDHATGTTYLLALAEDGNEDGRGSERDARAWLAATARRLAALAGERTPYAGPPAPLSEARLRHDRSAYLGLIDECLEEIAAGETYEVCLTNMAEARGDLDPWQGYQYLRRFSPAPFGALLRFGDLSVLSTSPERFLRVDRNGAAESRPIKGTRPRGATEQEDAALRAELLVHEKDRAENLMIVDLVRNDLGRCAETGSVDASGSFRVETYATVHQLVSTVRATLRPDVSAVACVRTAFPGGSMTGAPKLRTMRIIDHLENGPRGVYSGALGYFSLTGAADLSIVIRTAVVTPGRVRYGVGGAIVDLSDAAEEFEETVVKAAPLLALTAPSSSLQRRDRSRTARSASSRVVCT